MAERNYFSLRYAIPGYTFILFLFLPNFFPLWTVAKLTEIQSLLGGLLALLSGSVIGFLVSQLWWWWFEYKCTFYDFQPIKTLIEKYKLEDGKNFKQKRMIRFIYDYVSFADLHTRKDLKGISEYATRRWDVYILLSTARISLILGVVLGLAFRVFIEIFLFGMSALTNLKSNHLFFLGTSEFWFLLFVMGCAAILAYSIHRGIAYIRFEYQEVHNLAIEMSQITRQDLEKLFPKDYFKKEQANTSASVS